MPLQPGVARTLYRALLRTAHALEGQLNRCQMSMLRTKELDNLRAAASSRLPRDLRGLLEIHPGNSPDKDRQPKTSEQLDATSYAIDDATIQPICLQAYIGTCARRIGTASQAADLSTLDARVGFTTLRHLNNRVSALQQLVYTPKSSASRYGIHINVESKYQGTDGNRYIFQYQVRMINASNVTIKLLSRSWTIRDYEGRVTYVQGPGVVGAFPTLAPEDTYEYSSAVPLQAPLGTQSGHYMFVNVTERPIEDEQEHARKSRMLQVPVAPFGHRTPSMEGQQVQPGAASSAASQSVKATRRKRRKDETHRR